MKNNRLSCIPPEWKKEQESLRQGISLYDFDISTIKYVAGIDVAYTQISSQEYGCCSIIVIDHTNFSIVDVANIIGKIDVEYYPGFLSFRELPLVLEGVKKLTIEPDVFVFDGNGLLHPEKMGIATHASFYLKKTCIGVAKTFFRVEENLSFNMPASIVGASTNIINHNGETLGIALRTKQNCNPVFVSVGNYMSLENAKELIMHYITSESRIPMPTRLADIETHKLRKKLKEEDTMFFSRNRKKANNNEKQNFCGGCKCSCTCDRGCNGDVKKCTSQKALEKNCSHCCQCFIGMWGERMRMESLKE